MTDDDQELLALLTLQAVPGIGVQTCHKLVAQFGSAAHALSAPQSVLAQYLKTSQLQALQTDITCAESQLKHIRAQGIAALTMNHPHYPERLRHIAAAPLVLHANGASNLLNAKATLGIVGSRRMSDYGRRILQDWIPELVAHNVTIVSGMAFGIDACAHEMTLAHAGQTVAILPMGVNVSQPRGNQKLYDAIVKMGCVVSEFALFEQKQFEKGLFPRRNRLISGMSDALFIVEANEESGALTTAHYALEQGRSVIVLPGRIDQMTSRGCLQLIRQGAKVALSVHDILEELRFPPQMQLSTFAQKEENECIHFDSPLEERIYNLCAGQGYSMDQFIELTGEPAPFVSAVVTKLQVLGYLHQDQQKRYGRTQ